MARRVMDDSFDHMIDQRNLFIDHFKTEMTKPGNFPGAEISAEVDDDSNVVIRVKVAGMYQMQKKWTALELALTACPILWLAEYEAEMMARVLRAAQRECDAIEKEQTDGCNT